MSILTDFLLLVAIIVSILIFIDGGSDDNFRF